MKPETTRNQPIPLRQAVTYKSEYTDTLQRLRKENSRMENLKYFLDTACHWSAEEQRAKMKPDVVVLGPHIPEELILLVQHMILAHHGQAEFGSPKPPMFPEAEVLHVLDLLDARMFEMNRELANVQPGCFTERIWSLERKLYRRLED